VADFQVVYKDGLEKTIEIKGFSTEISKLKRKLFDFKYPEKTLDWITLSVKYGGWVDYAYVQKMRRLKK
jgi:hypothetical protein